VIGDCQTKRLGCFQIDEELESRWLFDRQVGGFAPLRILSTYPAAMT
jgi:hypothetical protein